MNTPPSLSRRDFHKWSLAAALTVSAGPFTSARASSSGKALRLGGPVSAKNPDSWIKSLKQLGYRAAYCPVGANASDDVIRAYQNAARQNDIIIAEVGAWSNPISPVAKTRHAALEKCRRQLALADRIGANCCVNICGSRNPKKWDGPHPDDLSEDTFHLVVETTRAIIDAVKPTRTFFTLETMPWAWPDSPDAYLRLFKAIDRPRFAVHLDPVNLVNSPRRYAFTGDLIRECFAILGPHIKSCHAKDIKLDTRLTTHLDEIRPGLGGLDYAAFLTELSKYPDVPLMLEHLPNQQEYKKAADHIRTVAQKLNFSF